MLSFKRVPVAALCVAFVGVSAGQAQVTSTSERPISAINCRVHYIDKVEVPAESDGKITELLFEEGDVVTAEQTMAVVDDTAAKLGVEMKRAEEKEALLNASNDINLKDAIASKEVAEAEYESYKVLRREGAIPYWETEKKRLEAERQGLRISLAEMEQKIAQVKLIAKRNELEMAEFELTKRLVAAPYAGYIEKRIAQQGQWVQPGSPIATLIRMDRLRVEGDINALDHPGVVKKGTPVQVTVFQGNRNITIDGVIGYVSMEVGLNDRNNIWVEIENEKFGDDWRFKPGMKAEITIK